jgi:hypothetical protein
VQDTRIDDGVLHLDNAASRLSAVLDSLRANLGELAEIVSAGELRDVSGSVLADTERELRVMEHRLAAARLIVLPIIGADGVWALDGSRSFGAWLARRDDVVHSVAVREIRSGEVLRDYLLATRAAALSGIISSGHVAALVQAANTDARRAALIQPVSDPLYRKGGDEAGPVTGEEYLLSEVSRFTLGQFRHLVARFAHVADPEADERGYRDAAEREFLSLGHTFGGWNLQGFLTDEHGEALHVALDSLMGAPGEGDERTVTQRRAGALADLARVCLDGGLTGTGAAVRPHITVTVSWQEFQRQVAESGSGIETSLVGPELAAVLAASGTPAMFEGSTGPLAASLLRKIACDSEITRVVFGPDSQILNVGRAQRTITGQLRRAVIARDKQCTFPGCEEPPSRCEVHHAQRHWAKHQGETSTDNAALLCWHHHSFVDTNNISMRWDSLGDIHGWHFTDRHGRPIKHRSRWDLTA